MSSLEERLAIARHRIHNRIHVLPMIIWVIQTQRVAELMNKKHGGYRQWPTCSSQNAGGPRYESND